MVGECGRDFRMPVAEARRGNARAEVEIAFAVRIKNVAALAVGEGDGETGIRWDDVGVDAGFDFF